MAPEGFLQVAQRAVFRGEVANRLDSPARRLNGKRQTAPSRSSIDQDRARTANPVFAADVNLRAAKLLAQEIAQQHARFGEPRAGLPLRMKSTGWRTPSFSSSI